MFRNYQLPKGIVDFLSDIELYQLSYVNKLLYNDTKIYIKSRHVNNVLLYFYDEKRKDDFRIRNIENKDHNYICTIFQFLPDLFRFIKVKKITTLDLSTVSSYGGYPEYIDNFMRNGKDKLDEILSLIKCDDSLKYINIGLFEDYVDRDRLKEIILDNNTLMSLSIRSEKATTSSNLPSTRIRRKGNEWTW